MESQSVKVLLAACMVLVATACKPKKQPPIPESVIALVDTVINPYSESDHIADSLQTVRKRDSFYAIKPKALLVSDKNGEAYKKLIALLVDTNGVTKTPLAFSDTIIYKYDKDQNPIAGRQVLRNKRFIVKLVDTNWSEYAPRRIYINGREMRPGIEIDTSQSGTFYVNNIQIDAEDCYILKFGAKEYLLLNGSVEKCTGTACGVGYYLLFDPRLQKALIVQLFRSEFVVGYDKTSKAPVFIDLSSDYEYNHLYQCFLYSGKVYSVDHSCKIKPVVDQLNNPYHLTAYSKEDGNSIVVVNGNFRTIIP
jgi:hypothetical protein